MQIKKVIETEDGTVIFTGELKGEELQAVLEVGLNVLYQNGALPFRLVDDESAAHVVFPSTDKVQ